eukprot:scaffold6301_cov165-Amphora_coffeaeformis.AAC.8
MAPLLPGSMPTRAIPIEMRATPHQPFHVNISFNHTRPKTVPIKTDPPTTIGMLCIACTPMPEIKKLSSSAAPTAKPAAAAHAMAVRVETTAALLLVVRWTSHKSVPTVAATN